MNWRMIVALLLICSSAWAQKNADEKSEPVFFYVVIPSHNNEQYCIQNLESIVRQDYPHWRAIYINDLSADRTGNIVQDYLTKHNLHHRIKLVHNWKRKGMLANIYNAVRKAKKNWVVVTVDGDDTLRGNDVFSHLAKVYSDPNVWMTYGNWESEPKGRLPSDNDHIPAFISSHNKFRKYKFCTTQLRTFYAGLFHKIKKRDLQHKGKFFMAAGDVAFMIPLLEMSSLGHFHFVERVIYNYNLHNPINDFKVNGGLQGWCARQVGKKKPYKPLKKATWK
ncbi:MAG: glycosyltransferase family 2 protein [Verrucomicrobia bacterium]|nr:glycosyltransferase family 2 protein [Verrucomicrobiota bacterium]